ADEDARAQLLEPLGVGAGFGVGALNRIADFQHDLGDAAHADAAYADKVDRAEIERDGTKTSDHPSGLARVSRECTTRRTISPRPRNPGRTPAHHPRPAGAAHRRRQRRAT